MTSKKKKKKKGGGTKQLHFTEENYLNYTKKGKRHNFACDIYIFLKQRETRTSSGAIWVPLKYSTVPLPGNRTEE